MQIWHIFLAGATIASIVAGILFLPDALRLAANPGMLFVQYWPALSVVWLGTYGAVALTLSALSALSATRRVVSSSAKRGWAQELLVRLELTQYFAAVLVLAALGLSPVVVKTEPFFYLPTVLSVLPALAACGILSLAGVLGWLALALTAVLFKTQVPPQAPTALEIQLLNEILELLRVHFPEPPPGSLPILELVQRGDRSILEAIKELAIFIDKLRNSLNEIIHALQHSGTAAPSQSNLPLSSDSGDIAHELRTAAATVTASVRQLENIAATLLRVRRSPYLNSAQQVAHVRSYQSS